MAGHLLAVAVSRRIDESAAASLATSIPRFRDRPKNGT
jgi:hypothetical protein